MGITDLNINAAGIQSISFIGNSSGGSVHALLFDNLCVDIDGNGCDPSAQTGGGTGGGELPGPAAGAILLIGLTGLWAARRRR